MTFVATNAIDGNLDTRWESTFRVDPSWITIDFGFRVYFAELDILWHADCPSAYDIDLSDDGASWTTFKSFAANPPSSQPSPPGWTTDDAEKIGTAGRYLRIHGTERAQSQFGYSIWEMRALGDRNPSCTP
jgi:cytochrome c